MTVRRTITLDDLEPHELAELFCAACDHEQADFFEAIGKIASDWPGAGWCQQCYSIARKLSPAARAVIEKLAEHVLGFDEMLAALHQYRSDMLYPPAADSRERRIAMIDAVLAKASDPVVQEKSE